MGAVSGAGGTRWSARWLRGSSLVGLFYVAWRSAAQVRKAAFCVPLLALLNCMGVISCLWSPEPTFTLKQGVYLLVTYTFAIAFVSKPAETQMKFIQLAGTIAVVLTVLTVAFFPAYGLNGRQGATGEWEGIYAGKNVCAMAMMFLLMPALYRKPATLQGRVLRNIYVLAVLGVIGMTRSRTGWGIAVMLVLFSVGIKQLARFKSFRSICSVHPVLRSDDCLRRRDSFEPLHSVSLHWTGYDLQRPHSNLVRDSRLYPQAALDRLWLPRLLAWA